MVVNTLIVMEILGKIVKSDDIYKQPAYDKRLPQEERAQLSYMIWQ